ncbi:MAG: PilZ domain-containing protein [Planctomycetota bacterium]|nr:PilZ domain-containing protein [Planctomycetota bacterium]
MNPTKSELRCDLHESEQHNRDSQRRRHGRVLLQEVSCTLGTVLDLSASGMRVLCTLKPPAIGSTITTTLQTLDGAVNLEAVVIWTRRTSIFKVQAGIEFRNLTAEVHRALTALARTAAQNETVRVPR